VLADYPGKRYLDWQLDDPAGQNVDAVRPIIEEIDGRVQGLLAELLATSASSERRSGAPPRIGRVCGPADRPTVQRHERRAKP
jgi:hypothetical protein